MTSEIQQAWNEIDIVSQNFDNSRRNLINLQMRIIVGMDDISLMPDVITLAINEIEISRNYDDLAPNLASCIYGLVFIAKARYQAVVKKSKIAASELLTTTANIFLKNIEDLLSVANQSITSILSSLRNLFFSNDNWIKKLINFFVKKFKAKEVKETYINFVNTVLEKISRQPLLMNKCRLYSEIAYDHYTLLVERKKTLLDKDYPNPDIRQKGYVLLLELFDLFVILCCFIAITEYLEALAIFFFCLALLLSSYIIHILRAFQKRKQLKESQLKSYKGWLEKIKSCGDQA